MAMFSIGITLLSAVLHASWNLLARDRREIDYLFHSSFLVALVGLLPTIAAEVWGEAFPARVWMYLPISGACLAMYYLGLTRGYRSGDFTVVYPVARALPVLIIAVLDVVLGNSPSPLGWLGIIMVSGGVMISPLESFGGFTLQRYRNQTTLWILLAVAGITGYTFVDGLAASLVTPGVISAIRYFVLQTTFSVILYWLLLRALHFPATLSRNSAAWRRPALIAALITTAYTLVLWAYQLSSEISYVVAVRQFSIVVGVVTAAYIFKEAAPKLRISAAIIIMVGISLIAMAG